MRSRQRLVSFLASRQLALALLFAIAALAVPGTLGTPAALEETLRRLLGPGLLPAARFVGLVDTYRSPLFIALLALLGLNVTCCTWQRVLERRGAPRGPGARRRRALPALDAALHLSLLAILAGAAGKGLWGFVRTRNLHVGERADAFYDFSRGADLPLGVTVEILERRDTYYPFEALVGVSDAATGQKLTLLELREGREAALPAGGPSLGVERFDAAAGTLLLNVRGGEGPATVALEAVAGGRISAAAGPFVLTLVAWRRELMRVEALVSCAAAGRPTRSAWISPQERLACGGVHFALTAWGTDAAGRPFVGLQAVREPTAPLFWGGCIALTLLLPLFLAGRRQQRHLPTDPGPIEG